MKTNKELEEEIAQLKHELCELRLKLLQQPPYTGYPVYVYQPPYLYPFYHAPVTCGTGKMSAT